MRVLMFCVSAFTLHLHAHAHDRTFCSAPSGRGARWPRTARPARSHQSQARLRICTRSAQSIRIHKPPYFVHYMPVMCKQGQSILGSSHVVCTHSLLSPMKGHERAYAASRAQRVKGTRGRRGTCVVRPSRCARVHGISLRPARELATQASRTEARENQTAGRGGTGQRGICSKRAFRGPPDAAFENRRTERENSPSATGTGRNGRGRVAAAAAVAAARSTRGQRPASKSSRHIPDTIPS